MRHGRGGIGHADNFRSIAFPAPDLKGTGQGGTGYKQKEDSPLTLEVIRPRPAHGDGVFRSACGSSRCKREGSTPQVAEGESATHNSRANQEGTAPLQHGVIADPIEAAQAEGNSNGPQ